MTGFDDWFRLGDPKLIAERHRISMTEFEKASAALAPAFALGLQQALESPARWAELSSAFFAMVPGQGTATRPGETFLDAIFGNPDLRKAISRQASTVTGIAPDILTRMMPDLAVIGVEAMARTVMGTMNRNQPAGLATGDFGGATAEMMRRGANAVEALTRPSEEGRPGRPAMATPFSPHYFTDAFSQALRAGMSFFPGAPATAPQQQPTAPRISNPADPVAPFAVLFDAFAKGMQAAADATPTLGEPPPSAPAASVPEDKIAGGFLASGRQMQEDYAREMAALFERYAARAKAQT